MLDRIEMYLILVSWQAFAGACAPSSADLARQLENRDPHARIGAIVQAAESEQTALLPNLVDRLEDEDSAVRFFAIMALEKLVGHRLGYSYSARPAERAKAVQAWRDLLAESHSVGPDVDRGMQ